jgi:ubiquinone/menaquinone biosynthesis C-methylase UbiE
MDASTEAVRELYELFPYPSGSPKVRLGFDARYLLSLVTLERPAGRPLRVLDAGCSRGVGTLALAVLQPDVQVLGIDLNRVALEEARAEAARRELTNIEFAEVDLSNLDGLVVPDGGFDVIICSGVLHHLVDPTAGLRRLKEVLAPHGVLNLMVYSKTGRREILEVSRAIDTLVDKALPIPGQLEQARKMVAEIAADPDAGEIWREATTLDDVEFVDRYLHIQERVYDVPELFQLIEDGGLEFLRWTDPATWRLNPGAVGEVIAGQVMGLGDRQLAHLVDNLGQGPPVMEVYMCQPGNSLRPAPAAAQLGDTVFAAHPEVRFVSKIRNTWCATRTEALGVELRTGEATLLAPGPLHSLVGILATQNQPFFGRDLIGILKQEGHSPAVCQATFFEALQREWLYCPHSVELG